MSADYRTNDLTEGAVGRKLLRFFFPIFFGLLFQQLYNTADAFIVGRFVGDSALAAVGGSTASITNLLIGFFTGLNTGATVLIGQRAGARDDAGLSRMLHTAVLFCALLGLGITVLGLWATPAMLRLLDTPEDIMADSVLYLRIYLIGAAPLLLYNLLQGTLQGLGDSRRPLIYLVISCLLNIALDLLFVAVLKLGVAGAGIASVISMVVCFALALVYMLRAKGPERLRLSRLRLERVSLRHMLRVGLPAALQGTMFNLSNVIITAVINGFGTAVVTAWTATGKLDGFYWVTSSAFGVAICSFVAQCYGAQKPERMKQGIRLWLIICLVITVGFSVTLLALARPVYRLFLSDESTIDLTLEIMRFFVPYYFIWTFVELLSGVFRGTGDTMRPMIISLLGTCALRVVWVLTVVPRYHTLKAVCLVYIVSWVVTAAGYGAHYLRGGWSAYRVKE